MEENSVIRNNNFIVIQGFMINDLKLSGNELIVFACIYGFSQDGEQVFNGSLKYLANWTNSTKRTVSNCLKSLLDKKLIGKNEKITNGVKSCEYYSKVLEGGMEKFSPVWKNFHRGIEKFSPNNIEYNIDIYTNNNNNIRARENLYSFIENNFNRTLNPIEYEEISTWEDNELTRYAIKQAVLKNVYSIKYISRILYSYKTKCIETVAQAQQAEEMFKNKKGKNNRRTGWDILNEMEQKFIEEEEIERRKKENEQSRNY